MLKAFEFGELLRGIDVRLHALTGLGPDAVITYSSLPNLRVDECLVQEFLRKNRTQLEARLRKIDHQYLANASILDGQLCSTLLRQGMRTDAIAAARNSQTPIQALRKLIQRDIKGLKAIDEEAPPVQAWLASRNEDPHQVERIQRMLDQYYGIHAAGMQNPVWAMRWTLERVGQTYLAQEFLRNQWIAEAGCVAVRLFDHRSDGSHTHPVLPGRGPIRFFSIPLDVAFQPGKWHLLVYFGDLPVECRSRWQRWWIALVETTWRALNDTFDVPAVASLAAVAEKCLVCRNHLHAIAGTADAQQLGKWLRQRTAVEALHLLSDCWHDLVSDEALRRVAEEYVSCQLAEAMVDQEGVAELLYQIAFEADPVIARAVIEACLHGWERAIDLALSENEPRRLLSWAAWLRPGDPLLVRTLAERAAGSTSPGPWIAALASIVTAIEQGAPLRIIASTGGDQFHAEHAATSHVSEVFQFPLSSCNGRRRLACAEPFSKVGDGSGWTLQGNLWKISDAGCVRQLREECARVFFAKLANRKAFYRSGIPREALDVLCPQAAPTVDAFLAEHPGYEQQRNFQLALWDLLDGRVEALESLFQEAAHSGLHDEHPVLTPRQARLWVQLLKLK